MGKAKKIRNRLRKEQASNEICEATSSRYYKRNASGKILAILTPDPFLGWTSHVGEEGEVCWCELQRDHLCEPGIGIVRRCSVKPQDNV